MSEGHADLCQALIRQMQALARFVLCVQPGFAEGSHAAQDAIAEYVAHHGSLSGKWFRCGGPRHGFIRVDEVMRSGCFEPKLPSDVDLSQVLEIDYDPLRTPLLDRMKFLMAEIERVECALRDGSDGQSKSWFASFARRHRSKLELAAMAHTRTTQQQLVSRMETVYTEDYESNYLFEVCQRGLACLGDAARMRGFVKAEALRQCSDHLELKTYGTIVSRLLVAFYLSLAFDDGKAGGSTGVGYLDYSIATTLRPWTFAGVFGFLMAAAKGAFHFQINQLLNRAVASGHADCVATAAEALRLLGDRFMGDARVAVDYSLFQQHLMAAIPWYHAANLLYAYLANSSAIEGREQRDQFESLAVKGCEEKLVRCSDSLHHAILDVSGKQLSLYRDEVAEAFRTQGRLAAEQLVTEYIELRCLYPRSYRPLLHPKP